MLLGLAVLLLFQALGELLSLHLMLPLPGPVVGMALLTVALVFSKRRPRGVERASRGLLVTMPLFFIPAGVGAVELSHSLRGNWLPVAAALVGSTLIALCVTAWAMKALCRESSR